MAHVDLVTGQPRPHNIVHGSYPHLVLFLVLNMWPAFLGLPVLIAIVLFSTQVKRHGTFLNFCVAFLITGIVSSLLVYFGKFTGPEPAPMLCLLQASTIYGVPPLESICAFMLVLQMFLKIRAAHHGKPCEDDDHKIRFWVMIISPYVVYFIFVLATAIVGANDPRRVSRNRRFFYCSVENLPLTNTIAVVCSIILLATVILEAWTLILLIRHRKIARLQGSSLRRKVDLSFPVRILSFGLYIITAMSLSLISVTSPSSPVPDLVLASAPTVFILIFGTQRDMIRAMCVWKRCKPIYVEPDAKTIDLRYAFDAESTFAKPVKF
ncbi:hypothetical protein CC2G_010296 [Coprinopsis cinerea AmutBmut pab1-1]|nr:hypothetical protein CC2G_010296 [Coprinopsis cinerea AmutBmut pab1-1]